MALGFHLLHPKIFSHLTKFHTQSPFPSITHLTINTSNKPQISCTKSVNDSELVSDLAAEVEKMDSHQLQREEAMKKSRQLLFTELCEYLGLKPEELKKKWKKMDDDEEDGGGGEEDKWVLVKGFVSEWGVNFHPLSASETLLHALRDCKMSRKVWEELIPPSCWLQFLTLPLLNLSDMESSRIS
ncbi:hypothetical protein HYC85_024511 [Camellia sinensis]|uniref:DUF7026 domain-containing protein n=1 Tax=Camellia sinensis TaxID=4442 RepID=A0A7J7G9L5_CAMSI|nr:hypothetical protein HYC85_024511 [Camellia sinensis]